MNPTVLLAALLLAPAAHGASIAIETRDAKGAALEDAVVWAVPKPGPAPRVRKDAAIAQQNKQFLPLVSVVQVGTQVQFPNRDEIRHHVYSFSAAKNFEIKLYAGTAAPPQLFDKPGEVVLGCNIHDHMIAYLYVVDTPWFAKTGKDGRARLEGLPAGDYEVHVQHYAQAAKVDARPVKLKADEAASAAYTVATKVVLTAPAPPSPK